MSEVMSGSFIDSLKRNNKQIRDDRALAIGKAAKRNYKRMVEDLADEIDDLKTDRENMLDMSPTNTQSLIVASDFKAEEFIKKDLEIGLAIHNRKIALEIAKKRYEELFGPLGAKDISETDTTAQEGEKE